MPGFLGLSAPFSALSDKGGRVSNQLYTKLKRRLKEFAARYPQCARLEYENGQGGVSYVVDRRRVPLRFSAPYTEERVQKAREYVKINASKS